MYKQLTHQAQTMRQTTTKNSGNAKVKQCYAKHAVYKPSLPFHKDFHSGYLTATQQYRKVMSES